MEISEIPTSIKLFSNLQTLYTLSLRGGIIVGQLSIESKNVQILIVLKDLIYGVILQYKDSCSSHYTVFRVDTMKTVVYAEIGSYIWISFVTPTIPVPVVLDSKLDVRMLNFPRAKLIDADLNDIGLLHLDFQGSGHECCVQSYQNRTFSVDSIEKECRGFIHTTWNCSSTPRIKLIESTTTEKKQKMSLPSINVDKKVLLEYNQSIIRCLPSNLVFACPDGEYNTSTLLWKGRFDTLVNFEQPTKCEFKSGIMEKLQQIQTGCFSGECITEEVIEAAEYYQVELGEVFWSVFEQEAVKKTPESYINSKIERVRHAAWKLQKGTRWYKDVNPEYKGELLDQLAGGVT